MPVDRDTIIKEIQRVAREKGVNKLSRSDFISETGISAWKLYQVFDSWHEACELAGLDLHYQHIKIDDNDLFNEMFQVFLDQDGLCTRTKFDRLSKFSVDTYRRRFGKWEEVLLAFRQWIEDNKIEFPFIDELPSVKGQKVVDKTEIKEKPYSKVQQWQSTGGTTYGPFLNFCGLQHAPINEQGDVFLFGMVCSELGFVVEAIRTAYPDCEAKRLLKKGKWERAMIEFEFRSGNFKEHGHNPEHCDVIVCWEHDWPECPVEVIELKSAIKLLEK